MKKYLNLLGVVTLTTTATLPLINNKNKMTNISENIVNQNLKINNNLINNDTNIFEKENDQLTLILSYNGSVEVVYYFDMYDNKEDFITFMVGFLNHIPKNGHGGPSQSITQKDIKIVTNFVWEHFSNFKKIWNSITKEQSLVIKTNTVGYWDKQNIYLIANSVIITKNIKQNKSQDQNLMLNLKWGEVAWMTIIENWQQAEIAFQEAAVAFQHNQDHAQFRQAEQNILAAKQTFADMSVQWQHGLQQWNNSLQAERNQQWWNNNQSDAAKNEERQWVHNKMQEVANKLGTSLNVEEVDRTLKDKWATYRLIKDGPQNKPSFWLFLAAGYFGIASFSAPFVFGPIGGLLGIMATIFSYFGW